ncbi:MAG: hypothetical protein K6E78_04320 [Treponema sp.]|nr:hypothetical protein [Treponema sp.]
MVLFCSSCSQVLNMALIPFAPSFIPSISFTSNGAEISYSLSTEVSYSKSDNQDWTRDYAYYIWRSTENPYQNYELIKRVYISSAAKSYRGHSTYKGETTYTDYDFTLDPSDPLNLSYTSDGKIIDPMPLTTTCYYRVSKVTLHQSHSKSDDSDRISYSLSPETSGWISSENK